MSNKEFEIEHHDFTDDDICHAWGSCEDVISVESNNELIEYRKPDVIAMAKHFKLTLDDLI